MRTKFVFDAYLIKLPETNWMLTDFFKFIYLFFLAFHILSNLSISIFQSWHNPKQSLPVQTTSLPPPSQSHVCCVTHSSAFHNAPVRDWKLFLFNSQVFLFYLHIFISCDGITRNNLPLCCLC